MYQTACAYQVDIVKRGQAFAEGLPLPSSSSLNIIPYNHLVAISRPIIQPSNIIYKYYKDGVLLFPTGYAENYATTNVYLRLRLTKHGDKAEV